MRNISTVLAALLGIAFFRILVPGPDHVAYWRVLIAAFGGGLVATGIGYVTGGIRARQKPGRLSR